MPNLGVYDNWSIKAKEILKQIPSKIKASNKLEIIATPKAKAKAKGLDVADFMIDQLRSQSTIKKPIIESPFSPLLQSFMQNSKPLAILINRLDLIEI